MMEISWIILLMMALTSPPPWVESHDETKHPQSELMGFTDITPEAAYKSLSQNNPAPYDNDCDSSGGRCFIRQALVNRPDLEPSVETSRMTSAAGYEFQGQRLTAHHLYTLVTPKNPDNAEKLHTASIREMVNAMDAPDGKMEQYKCENAAVYLWRYDEQNGSGTKFEPFYLMASFGLHEKKSVYIHLAIFYDKSAAKEHYLNPGPQALKGFCAQPPWPPSE